MSKPSASRSPSSVIRAVVLLACVGGVGATPFACESSSKSCGPGAEGCACTSGGACDPGLACLSKVCVRSGAPRDAGGGQLGGLASVSPGMLGNLGMASGWGGTSGGGMGSGAGLLGLLPTQQPGTGGVTGMMGTGGMGGGATGTGGALGTPGAGGNLGPAGTGGAVPPGAGGMTGAPPAMCTSPADATACRRCWDQRCCAQSQMCSGAPMCVGLLDCLLACQTGDSACANACGNRFPMGVTPLGNFLTCSNDNCKAACSSSGAGGSSGTGGASGAGGAGGSVAPPRVDGAAPSTCTPPAGANACGRCLNDGCCAQLTACTSSQACAGLATCVGRCASGDMPCINTCGNTYPAGVDTYLQLLDCTSKRCAAPCGG